MAAVQEVPTDEEEEKANCEKDIEVIGFDPPLYRQRYSHVGKILREHNIKSVVDFGCAECKVMPFYKMVNSLEEIVGVDIDEDTLNRSSVQIRPMTSDYLLKRSNPLRFRLYCGSVSEVDANLLQMEAVTMIEVIEHLQPDELDMFPRVVFGYLKPRLAVLTTPNAEFNVLFPNLTGFRHWDHKFEWTREEFQRWCSGVCRRYAYTVTYSGVGDAPTDRAHLGHCSQVAVFTRTEGSPELDPGDVAEDPGGVPTSTYKLVAECTFPCQDQTLSQDDRVMLQVTYYLRLLSRALEEGEGGAGYTCTEQWLDRDSDTVEISLTSLLAFPELSKLCGDERALVDVLEQTGVYTLNTEKTAVRYPLDNSSDNSDEVTEDAYDWDCDEVEGESFLGGIGSSQCESPWRDAAVPGNLDNECSWDAAEPTVTSEEVTDSNNRDSLSAVGHECSWDDDCIAVESIQDCCASQKGHGFVECGESENWAPRPEGIHGNSESHIQKSGISQQRAPATAEELQECRLHPKMGDLSSQAVDITHMSSCGEAQQDLISGTDSREAVHSRGSSSTHDLPHHSTDTGVDTAGLRSQGSDHALWFSETQQSKDFRSKCTILNSRSNGLSALSWQPRAVGSTRVPREVEVIDHSSEQFSDAEDDIT